MSLRTWLFPPEESAVATADNALDSVLWNLDPRTQFSALIALGVAAVFRSRQLNADTVASLPLAVADTKQPVPAPNMDQTWQELVSETILSLQDSGDAYWQVDSKSNIRVLPHTEMSVTWNAQMTRRVYRSALGGVLRHWGLNPPLVVLSINRGAHDATGFGPMQSKRIRGLIAEQDYSQEFFENNGAPTGTLSVPGEMSKPEADKLREQWIEARKVRAPAVLGGSATWDSTAFSPNDSEWVETHLAGIGDTATLFGIPGALLQYAMPGSSLTYEKRPRRLSGLLAGDAAPHLRDPYRGSARRHPEHAGTVRPRVAIPGVDPVKVAVGGDVDERRLRPDPICQVAGLPPLAHTGRVPTTVQPED